MAGDDASGTDSQCSGDICMENERVQNGQCVPCAPGTVSPGGDDTAGENTSCDTTFCPPDFRVADNTCVACAPNASNAAGDPASGPDTACDLDACAANERVASNKRQPCPRGTTNAAGGDPAGADTQCSATSCGLDERVQANACVACAPGTTNALGDDASGTDTTCDVTSCQADERVQDNACVVCNAGTGNRAGDDASGPDTVCDGLVCASNERVQSNLCVSCPAGSTNMAGDDASGPDTTCDAITCATDERVANNQCSSCPAGSTNAAGDDASGADTTCDSTLCQADERVQNNACTSCAVGTTNAPGDDASGFDTTCDAITCQADQQVSNNACVACPAGTTNAAGDDSSGVDTSCDPTLCLEDERVQGNACVACPADTTNAAGDLAAGSDTTCDDACAVALGVTCAEFSEEDLIDAGYNVAIDADTLVIGDPNSDVDASGVAGAAPGGVARVYTRVGATWSLQATLKASNAEMGDSFGTSVSIDGDTLIVGASGEDSDATGVDGDETNDGIDNAGAAYVFVRNNGAWTQQAYLKSSAPGIFDAFGQAVVIDGDTIAVGAPNEDSNALGVGGDPTNDMSMDSGAVYIFQRQGVTWSAGDYIKASAAREFSFGRALALQGDTLVAGAPGRGGINTNPTTGPAGGGNVNVYTRVAGVWSHEAEIVNGNTQNGDAFGNAIALDADTIVIGALAEDNISNSLGNSGVIYVYTRQGGVWTEQTALRAFEPDQSDAFGTSVAILGDTIYAGAIREQSVATGVNGDAQDDTGSSVGAVYTYTRSGSTWSSGAYIKPDVVTSTMRFGSSLAVDGSTLVIGASGSNDTFVRKVAP